MMNTQLTIFDKEVYVEIEQLSFLSPKRKDDSQSFQKWIAGRQHLTSIRDELTEKLDVCGKCLYGITRYDSTLPQACRNCPNLVALNNLGDKLIQATRAERRARRWAKMVVPKKWGMWK